MNLEGITTEVVQVGSPLGFTMNMRVTVIPDGCSTCEGIGTVRYVTEEDQQAWENREPCDCGPEDYCECDEYGPPANGTKSCEPCNGTGRIAGAGPLQSFNMTLAHELAVQRAFFGKLKEMEEGFNLKFTAE